MTYEKDSASLLEIDSRGVAQARWNCAFVGLRTWILALQMLHSRATAIVQCESEVQHATIDSDALLFTVSLEEDPIASWFAASDHGQFNVIT